MMKKDRPKISVVTASKNGARFLRETLNSVLNQTFTDYEHVVWDGASTDGTLDILKEYKHLTWESKPDSGPIEGFYRAISMARGEYIVISCVSDGFLCPYWFEKCVNILDSDPEISLVFGLPQYMSEDGSLNQIWESHFLKRPFPQKTAFLSYWLATSFLYPEIAYCVRSQVLDKCFPKQDSSKYIVQQNPFLSFAFNFNVAGYLPYLLPLVPSYGRQHHDSATIKMEEFVNNTSKEYFSLIKQYKKDILSGRKKHVFRDGYSNIIKEIQPNELKLLHRNIIIFYVFNFLYRWNRRAHRAADLIIEKLSQLLLNNTI